MRQTCQAGSQCARNRASPPAYRRTAGSGSGCKDAASDVALPPSCAAGFCRRPSTIAVNANGRPNGTAVLSSVPADLSSDCTIRADLGLLSAACSTGTRSSRNRCRSVHHAVPDEPLIPTVTNHYTTARSHCVDADVAMTSTLAMGVKSCLPRSHRSEDDTTEIQAPKRITYAFFYLNN